MLAEGSVSRKHVTQPGAQSAAGPARYGKWVFSVVCTEALPFPEWEMAYLPHQHGKYIRANWSSGETLGSLPSHCKQTSSVDGGHQYVLRAASRDWSGVSPFGNVPGKRKLPLVGSGHLLLQQKASEVALLLTVCWCFLDPEPRGCPEILGHSVGMSESPVGPKPAMLRADMPTAPSFQRAFTSSCTISGHSPSQRRGR